MNRCHITIHPLSEKQYFFLYTFLLTYFTRFPYACIPVPLPSYSYPISVSIFSNLLLFLFSYFCRQFTDYTSLVCFQLTFQIITCLNGLKNLLFHCSPLYSIIPFLFLFFLLLFLLHIVPSLLYVYLALLHLLVLLLLFSLPLLRPISILPLSFSLQNLSF